MQEIWKDIKQYEGLYQISDLGRIKNVVTRKILKPTLNKHGYLVIHLYKNSISKTFSVHRLVAEHFIANINGFYMVNHLDCNKQNNNVTNLEWITAKGNSQHASKKGRYAKQSEHMKRINEKSLRPVVAIKENVTLYYSSAKEAEKDGFSHSDISRCCNGKRKTHRGYVWQFAEV